MTQPISGIHHITAIASDPQKNVDFYTGVLGQRFVKKTINFDDPGTYHLYYGDLVGSPGTIMTFFPWPAARRGRRGQGEVGAIAYRIRPSSLTFWQQHLTASSVMWSEEERFGDPVLVFTDPDGLQVELVAAAGEAVVERWARGPLPEEHAPLGFHSVTLWVGDLADSAALLTGLFSYESAGREGERARFRGQGSVGEVVDLLHRPDLPRGQMGAGSVHHVAFRAADDEEQLAYQAQIARQGFMVTDVKDRQYFHSIYFREPAGVLFEIATDAPGFPLDEPVDELGKHLKLPPWLEPARARIEQQLPPLRIAEYE